MKKLEEADIRHRLAGLDGWQRDGKRIHKEYGFDDFAGSLAFVNGVAALAEEADHHPDIDIRFDRVLLALSTHSAGGLTSKDFELAQRIDGSSSADRNGV